MNTYWTLAPGPLGGLPARENFDRREGPVPIPGEGQALSRTIYVSLDPYQWYYKKRGVEQPGAVCHARTVSQILESRMDGFAEGDLVFNVNGWAQYGLMGAGIERPSYMVPRKLDPAQGRISLAVGVLGMLGLTAYSGMILLADPKAGETAVVSAASGGVGQIAGQLARLRGARTVGIAGREEKRRYVVEELGFDACVSHLSPTFAEDLRDACPSGVDVYFENVGGAVFDAVLPLFNRDARMTICGVIAQFGDDAEPDGKAYIMRRGQSLFDDRAVRISDLFVGDFVADHQESFLRDMAGWVAAGEVRYREDIRHGIDIIPTAFTELMRGGNFGKMLVQVADDPTALSRGSQPRDSG